MAIDFRPKTTTSTIDFRPKAPEEQFPIQQTSSLKAGGVVGAVQDFSQGVAKGGTSTILGIGEIGNKIQRGVAGAARAIGLNVSPSAAGETSIFNRSSPVGQKAQEIVTPQGTAQNIGYGTEKVAEFFVPATKAMKAENIVTALTSGIRTPLIAAASRVAGKATVQGVAAGAVTAAQTGGNVRDTLTSSATASILRGGFAIIGEGARALRIPERLYSTIFKNTKLDMLSELKEEGLKNLQVKNPSLYSRWVSEGLIKTGPTGAPILNETLAEIALDKGLRGSIRTMANVVVEKTIQSEDDVRRVLSGYKGTVNVTEPQFKNILVSISKEYKDVGFGEISKDALRLAKSITTGRGHISGIDALDIRRLLDRARIARSFDVPVSKLSLSQANLKQLADVLRGRINNIENVGSLMKDYTFYIDALESLASEASRRGNNQVLGLLGTVLLGGGIAGGTPTQGILAAAISKYLRSSLGTTAAAQALRIGTASPTVGAGIGAASSLLVGRE